MTLNTSWNCYLQAVRQMRDKRGMAVDEPVVEAVAALRFLGFSTIASCSGHPGSHTGGPYVNIESPEAANLAGKARELTDFKSEAYLSLREQANFYRAKDLEKILFYIDEFYKNKKTNLLNRLIVMSLPMSINVLCCQGAVIGRTMETSQEERLILDNQAEFERFTNFIKAKYIKV